MIVKSFSLEDALVKSANGWFRRARCLLEGLDPTPEHGWLAARSIHRTARTRRHGDRTTVGAMVSELGRALRSLDLEAVGMATEGLALVTEGRLEDGMPLLDEAAAAALGGDFEDLFAIPWTCCYVIYACECVHDYERAEQLCRNVEELTDRMGIEFAWGLCRAHHACEPIRRICRGRSTPPSGTCPCRDAAGLLPGIGRSTGQSRSVRTNQGRASRSPRLRADNPSDRCTCHAGRTAGRCT